MIHGDGPVLRTIAESGGWKVAQLFSGLEARVFRPAIAHGHVDHAQMHQVRLGQLNQRVEFGDLVIDVNCYPVSGKALNPGHGQYR